MLRSSRDTQRLREACPWHDASRYLLHDRDTAFRAWATTAAAMDIHEIVTAAQSASQNAYAERLIGSIRRECFDRLIVGNARRWSLGHDRLALVQLRRRALDVRRPRTLRAVGNLELDSITLAQICDALAIDSALVKEVFLPRLTLDEPKAFVHSQRPNCSRHVSISDLWLLTIGRVQLDRWHELFG